MAKMLRKATYQAGQAADEEGMFPSISSREFGVDPGLAWCEAAREMDPNGEIALALFRKLDAERREKDAKGY